MATKTGGSSCIWLAALHVVAAVIDAQPDSMARAANQESRGSFPLISQCRYRDLNTDPASIPRHDGRSIRLLEGDTTELKRLVEGARVRMPGDRCGFARRWGAPGGTPFAARVRVRRI
jgi:hypothetical protein